MLNLSQEQKKTRRRRRRRRSKEEKEHEEKEQAFPRSFPNIYNSTTKQKITMREKCPDERKYTELPSLYNYIPFFFFSFAVLRPSISMTHARIIEIDLLFRDSFFLIQF
jgi:hypothetical protein